MFGSARTTSHVLPLLHKTMLQRIWCTADDHHRFDIITLRIYAATNKLVDEIDRVDNAHR